MHLFLIHLDGSVHLNSSHLNHLHRIIHKDYHHLMIDLVEMSQVINVFQSFLLIKHHHHHRHYRRLVPIQRVKLIFTVILVFLSVLFPLLNSIHL